MDDEERQIAALLIADDAEIILNYIRKDGSLCTCERAGGPWEEDLKKTAELEKLLCEVINLARCRNAKQSVPARSGERQSHED